MTVEGVTFNERRVRLMKKKEFVEVHLKVCFTDRPVQQRRRMLGEIYDRIAGKGAG